MRSFFVDKLGLRPPLADAIEVLATLAVAVALALFAHRLVLLLLHRLTARTSSRSDDIVAARIAGPMRWILVALALTFVQRSLPLEAWAQALWQQAAGFLVPGLSAGSSSR